MRERDLKALEFDKVRDLVVAMAVSEPARRVVAELSPSGEASEVRERIRATAEMVEFRSHSGGLPIGEFTDQTGLMVIAAREGAVLDGHSLLRIREFVLSARHVAAFMRSRVDSFPHVAALAHDLVAPKELADAMLKALADDGGLLDDASRELKRLRVRLREERRDLETRLERTLNLPGMDPFLSDRVVTVRNRRFVLPLKLNYAERLEGIVQDRSVSGETLFVEPMWAVELNNRLMMLEREVEAEERRVLEQLTRMVRGYVRELRITFAALVAIDALNARAIFAERYRCIEPEITEAGLQLIAARHPLLMASGREVVPIDLIIRPEQNGIVISGPNTGGKTVALKTLGLCCLMAQAGLLIPADSGSSIGIFRGVFADIGDEQSIEADLSTFSAHIVNVADILRSVEEPALIILDEPGAGTDPAEGAALTIGLLDYLSRRRCLVAIATHSTAVKLHAYSGAKLESAAVDFDPENLEPRFKLKPHTIGQSFGLAVARRLGFPEEIVTAAEAARPSGTGELETALERLEQERTGFAERSEELRLRELSLAEQYQAALGEADRAREQAAAERERMREEFRNLVAEVRREGETVIDELKTQAKSRRDLTEFARSASERLARVAPEAPPEDAELARPLAVGDQVELAGADIRGELLVLEPERAVIGRGGLRIEVAPARLRPATRRQGGSPAPAIPAITVTASRPTEAELNLIGMRAADALRKLEEFLDQAYLTNKPEVRVVHGVGSGALRRAIHEYLSSSPYCAVFREAEPHSGGAGATIVELNS
jgi:DNA mismatch repair protein MutS2